MNESQARFPGSSVAEASVSAAPRWALSACGTKAVLAGPLDRFGSEEEALRHGLEEVRLRIKACVAAEEQAARERTLAIERGVKLQRRLSELSR